MSDHDWKIAKRIAAAAAKPHNCLVDPSPALRDELASLRQEIVRLRAELDRVKNRYQLLENDIEEHREHVRLVSEQRDDALAEAKRRGDIARRAKRHLNNAVGQYDSPYLILPCRQLIADIERLTDD